MESLKEVAIDWCWWCLFDTDVDVHSIEIS